ncbi:MAG: hypothetical protein VX464_11545 [Pseudomonadota bacterium]|nr:hypothetical protein [Pseudomonadota bacterium]
MNRRAFLLSTVAAALPVPAFADVPLRQYNWRRMVVTVPIPADTPAHVLNAILRTVAATTPETD